MGQFNAQNNAQIRAQIEDLRKQLREVNRDIAGMLIAGATTEKTQKVLKDAQEYRESLEDDLLRAVRRSKEQEGGQEGGQGKANEPVIIGVMIISMN